MRTLTKTVHYTINHTLEKTPRQQKGLPQGERNVFQMLFFGFSPRQRMQIFREVHWMLQDQSWCGHAPWSITSRRQRGGRRSFKHGCCQYKLHRSLQSRSVELLALKNLPRKDIPQAFQGQGHQSLWNSGRPEQSLISQTRVLQTVQCGEHTILISSQNLLWHHRNKDGILSLASKESIRNPDRVTGPQSSQMRFWIISLDSNSKCSSTPA